MSLIKYTNRLAPWHDLDVLAGRVNRIFGDAAPANVVPRPSWFPAASVQEFDAEFVLAVELPGVDEDSLDISLENNVLTISGEKRERREPESESEGKYHLLERTFGAFHRAVRLPGTVRAEEIAAELEHGLLTLRLPKAEEARTRKIEVSRRS